MIKEISAKSILGSCKRPSDWFGVKYLFNIYRGCEHQCIYCDSRSECYGIEDFGDLIVKTNSIELLRKQLASKRKKGLIGTGSMGDPYTISEKKYGLTRKALELISDFNYPVHITTKSNLVLRDIDMLEEINKIYASVSMTITTTDGELARKVEPYAPLPIERLKALGILSEIGICTSITLMPVLPFIEDNKENIIGIVDKASFYGVKHIVPWLGMSLRDRQRAYYYDKLDELFPGTREKYEKRFKDMYRCSANNSKKLWSILSEACDKYNISLKMPTYEEKITSTQISLFNGQSGNSKF